MSTTKAAQIENELHKHLMPWAFEVRHADPVEIHVVPGNRHLIQKKLQEAGFTVDEYKIITEIR